MRGIAALALAGCTAASADPGLSAWMRVEGAQFVPGEPVESGGPTVTSVANARSTARPGQTGKPFTGTLAPGSTAVTLGLAGDRGYWLLPAGGPAVQAPTEPTFAVSLSFAPDAPLGPTDVVLHAIDGAGRVGPAREEPLDLVLPAPPEGALVISLSWDTNADLDLHVVDPDGVEIWARNINSYQPPPPGEPIDPLAWMRGGILDFDSNAGCLVDGRRQENVVFAEAAPSGTYVVRVDPAALCGEAYARWKVAVNLADEAVSQATGVFVDASTRGKHGPGDGLEVLTFEVP
jgi:hypothetical protein